MYKGPDILANVFRQTTFNIFGELFFDFFDPEEHKPWTCDPTTQRGAGGLCQDYVSFRIKLRKLDTGLRTHGLSPFLHYICL